MIRSRAYLGWFSWFFMATLFLLSFQVTISGFQSQDSTIFSILIDLAEEESEDSETEIGKKWNESEFAVFHSSRIFISANRFAIPFCRTVGYSSIIYDIASPPPEQLI